MPCPSLLEAHALVPRSGDFLPAKVEDRRFDENVGVLRRAVGRKGGMDAWTSGRVCQSSLDGKHLHLHLHVHVHVRLQRLGNVWTQLVYSPFDIVRSILCRPVAADLTAEQVAAEQAVSLASDRASYPTLPQ